MLIEAIVAIIILRILWFFIVSPAPQKLFMVLVFLYFVGLYLFFSFKFPELPWSLFHVDKF